MLYIATLILMLMVFILYVFYWSGIQVQRELFLVISLTLYNLQSLQLHTSDLSGSPFPFSGEIRTWILSGSQFNETTKCIPYKHFKMVSLPKPSGFSIRVLFWHLLTSGLLIFLLRWQMSIQEFHVLHGKVLFIHFPASLMVFWGSSAFHANVEASICHSKEGSI